ncbi:tyrosine-type recombinase/integrase [Erwiniaceae bacterium BAC15a-03b]|uniref:Tyrosine-type recombinase/integrase n=1 Tax=Winslowiella arboricola TaxID=2978220 RepID=A0A9J6PVD8_9GAMM|nr:site-specific integrase [Winslowiella arboricola]MCU5775063.1 tyrosine-type recombinase/integrase [Winslowiella arboricola]MCU5780483.1 tyrosine-type recombinase/integrase [Winslowiella arboricola]
MMGEINKLSDKKLKTYLGSPREKEITVADGKGLSIRVSKSGHVSWVYAYRLGGRGSPLERISLGAYPDVSLKLAREKRDECRTWLADGHNPKAKIKESRDERLTPVTVKDALEYWLTEYAATNRSDEKDRRAQFSKHIYPFIGDMPLKDTETRHWLTCLDRVKRKYPVASGTILVAAKQAMKFCRVRNYAVSEALDLLSVPDVGKMASRRARTLKDKELGELWRAVNSEGITPYHSRTLKLLALFGSRTQEVRLSTWKEWDFDESLWTVPVLHSKNSEEIIRPIPDGIVSWLKELKGDAGRDDLILGELKSGEAVSQMCRHIYARLGHDDPWTPHDLRRTFSTKMNDLGIAPHVVEQLIGHRLGGIMAVYNRSQYIPEKRRAMEVWLERLELLGGNAENVVLLNTYAARKSAMG